VLSPTRRARVMPYFFSFCCFNRAGRGWRNDAVDSQIASQIPVDLMLCTMMCRNA